MRAMKECIKISARTLLLLQVLIPDLLILTLRWATTEYASHPLETSTVNKECRRNEKHDEAKEKVIQGRRNRRVHLLRLCQRVLFRDGRFSLINSRLRRRRSILALGHRRSHTKPLFGLGHFHSRSVDCSAIILKETRRHIFVGKTTFWVHDETGLLRLRARRG